MRNRKFFLPLLIALIFLIGIGTVAYPYVSNLFYEQSKSEVITAYDEAVKNVSQEEVGEELAKAREYNESLLTADVVLTDPFDPSALDRAGEEPYASLLNVDGDSSMGYVEIPLIDVNLPIYHGTSAEVLETGIGHLESTSLPVGGTGTHAVLTGHTGLAGKKLFTDLTELRIGDIFYIHVLGDILAYQVNQIEIVEPENTGLLLIDRSRDYVTLLTCYPYGINSHRLLVRGERTELSEALEQETVQNRQIQSRWEQEYQKAVILCIIVYIPLTFLIIFFLKRRMRQLHRRMKRDTASHAK